MIQRTGALNGILLIHCICFSGTARNRCAWRPLKDAFTWFSAMHIYTRRIIASIPTGCQYTCCLDWVNLKMIMIFTK